jgi:hypothetical protein
MPSKVDDSQITAKVVKALIANKTSSTRKLAKLAGTTSPKKIRQIAEIAGMASFYLGDQMMKEIEKLRIKPEVLQSVENAIMVPHVMEQKDGPAIITLEPMSVAKARVHISQEVEEAVSRPGVIPESVKGKTIKVQFSRKLTEKAAARAKQ